MSNVFYAFLSKSDFAVYLLCFVMCIIIYFLLINLEIKISETDKIVNFR